MPALERSADLIADLAHATGLSEIPRDDTGGWHLSIGEADDAYVYSQDDVRVLIVVPVASLPADVSMPVVSHLLRENLFDSEFAPFQIALDEGGMVVQWGFLPIDALSGAELARILDNLALRAAGLRAMLER